MRRGRDAYADHAGGSQQRLDIDALRAITGRVKPIEASPSALPQSLGGLRIGLARDAAFSFVYEAGLITLEAMGTELVPFSPLLDPALPEDIHALYLPGGFPAHEFHHSVVEPDLPLKTRFKVTKGGERYREG